MRDPAPSRLAYRINRLMLTPRFRLFLRFGLPTLAISASVAFWASDEARRDALAERVAELRRQVEERPEFMVRMMVVDGASEDVEAEIRDILPVDFPLSSFDLDLDTLQDAVEDLNAVASATVQVRGAGVLSVAVEERVPVAIWRLDDRLTLVDATSHPVAEVSTRAARPDMPLILGKGADDAVTEALAILAVTDTMTGRLRGLRRMGERRWDILLDRGQVIMLPETDPVTAVRRVLALDAAQDLLERDVVAVDFRNLRRPVLRLSGTAMDDMAETRTRAFSTVSE